jgi:D-3-phosphoglycerate dehydrogenase
MPDSVFVSTAPFGESDPRPLEMLRATGVEFRTNPLGHRLSNDDLCELIGDASVLIAGTEPINEKVFSRAPQLRLIVRVGIGLDSVDLAAARRRGIEVAYTPDAPGLAVAELTVGLMLDLLRGISGADRALRAGKWKRHTGSRIATSCVGVVGVGRIGTKVIRHLTSAFPGVQILANDIQPVTGFEDMPEVRWVEKDELLRESDIVTLHLPFTPATRNLLSQDTLALMRKGSFLINTSRGGIVNENDLAAALRAGTIAGAALDVFEHEPYSGPLLDAERCVLTCHMGSMTHDCRARMEIEATEDACRFLRGETLLRPVPEMEYENQFLTS